MRRFVLSAALVPLLLLLTACNGDGDGGDVTPTPTTEAPAETPGNGGGDGLAAQGEAIFTGDTAAAQPVCSSCHQVTETAVVGPGLGGIATRAGERVDGLGAEEYLRQSIVEPDSYVVEGFQPGLMQQDYGEQLSDEQIDALVAYLMTLT